MHFDDALCARTLFYLLHLGSLVMPLPCLQLVVCRGGKTLAVCRFGNLILRISSKLLSDLNYHVDKLSDLNYHVDKQSVVGG